MDDLIKKTPEITELILKAAKTAREQTSMEPEPEHIQPVDWPIDCTVGPGLEGAIACESKIGYVNGAKGALVYRGYDIFDLCAYCTYEEVAYLLLHGDLPTRDQLNVFKHKLIQCRPVHDTLRVLMGFSVEEMNPMAALRLGSNLMRQQFSSVDMDLENIDFSSIIGTDEDSISNATTPMGEEHAIYEFERSVKEQKELAKADDYDTCYHLISGVSTIAAAVARVREGKFPIDPDPQLGHAANLIYMMTGKKPTPEEERIMDISLILHADHGMNASTFASMVVASTLSDIYFSVGAGISALNGPLHGGANEAVLHQLNEIGSKENVKSWYEKARSEKRKVMGFGHRVYKAYDPRARVLAPLAEYMSERAEKSKELLIIAKELEQEVDKHLGQKGIFPNVDFYSGVMYSAMGIDSAMFTPIFAVSRVAGWTARVMEYMENNRIFRPRARYIGEFGKQCKPINER